MLAFITSLRHPRNSADYPRVEQLLKATLASVAGQSTDDFVVIVVGNKRPEFDLPSRVHFVPVEFPPPSTHNGPQTPLKSFVWDKGTKVGIGLAAARAFGPDYVMLFDADDFVHRDLARFANDETGADGWVIDQGYVFSSSRNVYRRQPDFNRSCGTCHIVSYDSYHVPLSLDTGASQEQVSDAFGERMWRIMGAHRDALEWFSGHGVLLRPLPFRGAVYHVDTGENHSGQQLRGIARPLRPSMRSTFGIADESTLVADLLSGFGPGAIVGSGIGELGRARRWARRKAQRRSGEGNPGI